MPTARSRSFDNRAAFTGTYRNVTLGTTTTRSLDTGLFGTCDDTIGNYPNANGLAITRKNQQYPGLVGQRFSVTTGVLEREMNNFPLGSHPGPIDPRGQFPALTSLDKSNFAWRILAEANPSSPDISLPTFIGELKDLPSLMKNWYKMFIRGKKAYQALLRTEGGPGTGRRLANLLLQVPEILASGHLTWRWAIRPFIRDVQTLCDTVFLVNKRVDLLKKLANGRVIRRTVSLRKDSKRVVQTGQILHSEGIVLKGTRTTAYTEKVWGSVSYRMPGGKLFPTMNAEVLSRARRLVFGITTHEALATAWELMPWSWFVDWFAGIGTVITATNNSLGLVHNDCCLMRFTSSETTIGIDNATSESWARPNRDYLETYERKERFVVAPLLPFAPTYLPLLSGKALSILGSLAILREQPGRYLGPELRKVRK